MWWNIDRFTFYFLSFTKATTITTSSTCVTSLIKFREKNKILQCSCRRFSVCLLKPIFPCMYLTKFHVSEFFLSGNFLGSGGFFWTSTGLNCPLVHFKPTLAEPNQACFFCCCCFPIVWCWGTEMRLDRCFCSTRQAKLNQLSLYSTDLSLPGGQSFCSFLKKSPIVVK